MIFGPPAVEYYTASEQKKAPCKISMEEEFCIFFGFKMFLDELLSRNPA